MSMDNIIKIPAKCNRKIELKAIPGHFATNHSHINYYLDMTPIKYRHTEAQLVAKEMVKKYRHTTAVDAIVCMDGCEVIGAYLAEECSIARMSLMRTVFPCSLVELSRKEFNGKYFSIPHFKILFIILRRSLQQRESCHSIRMSVSM